MLSQRPPALSLFHCRSPPCPRSPSKGWSVSRMVVKEEAGRSHTINHLQFVSPEISPYAPPNIAIIPSFRSFLTSKSRCRRSSPRLPVSLRGNRPPRRPAEKVKPKLVLLIWAASSISHVGAAARPWMRSRSSANRASETATSAHWKIVLLEWDITFAPIFISFSWMLERDQ
jgi:hypothetical protein